MNDVTLELSLVQAGPIRVLAPSDGAQHVKGTHGDLWQWTGDGRELISLLVAVRQTRLGTATGVRHHLNWEMDRLEGTFESDFGAARQIAADARVHGSRASASGTLRGVRSGIRTYNLIVVTSALEWMHVTHIMAPDLDVGRQVAAKIMSSVEVTEWGGDK